MEEGEVSTKSLSAALVVFGLIKGIQKRKVARSWASYRLVGIRRSTLNTYIEERSYYSYNANPGSVGASASVRMRDPR